MESATLRRRAVERIEREHPGGQYRAADNLFALRTNLGRYLPPTALTSRLPVNLQVETYPGARMIRLIANATDASYTALFANALNHSKDPLVRYDVWIYLAAALFFSVLAPFRSRWRMLVGGLAGAALTTDTPTMQRVAVMVPLLGLLPALFLDRVAGAAPAFNWRLRWAW